MIEGYDATMRLVAFIDLNTRYKVLQIRMWFFKKKIEKQLRKDMKNLQSHKENN